MSDDTMGQGVTCPDDGTLLLHLDGELHGSDAEETRDHIAACSGCQERVFAIRRAAEQVRAALLRHDPPPPPREDYDLQPRRSRRGGSPWRKWAAAAAIVVAAGTVVSPVRAFVVEHVIENVREWIPGSDAPLQDSGGSAVAALPDGDTASPGTAFSWAGTEVTLRFVSEETRGELAVVPAGDSLVTVRSFRADVPLRVQRGTVEVDNGAAPVGDYSLAVPPTVHRVFVVVAGDTVAVMSVEGAEGSKTVPLRRDSPSGGTSP